MVKKIISIFIVISSLFIITSCENNVAETKLLDAMQNQNFQEAKEAIECGADLNTTTASVNSIISPIDKNTISFCTVSDDANDIAIYLIESGADVNYNCGEASLLMSEISMGNIKVCESLLKNGADVNYSFFDGYSNITVLNYLFENRYADKKKLVNLIFEYGFCDEKSSLNDIINFKYSESYNNMYQIENLSDISYLIDKAYNDKPNNISKLLYYLSQGDSNNALKEIENNHISDNEKAILIFAGAFCDIDVISCLVDKLHFDYDTVLFSDNDGEYNILDVALAYNTTEVSNYLYDLFDKPDLNELQVKMSVLNANNPKVLNFVTEHIQKINLDSLNTNQNILYYVAKCKRLDFLKKFTNQLNTVEKGQYETCLITAADNNDIEMLSFFNNHGYNDLFDKVLLYTTCNIDTYKLIYENSLNPQHTIVDGYSLLCKAVDEDYTQRVKFLLEDGCDINSKDELNGNSPIFYAIQRGNIEMLKFLIDNGADLEIKNDNGETPLICAVNSHSHNSVEYLVTHGASVNTTDSSDCTPKEIAENCAICRNDKEMSSLFQ